MHPKLGLLLSSPEPDLGTIARSGSKSFLQQLEAEGGPTSASSMNVIGQFGVGFYSVFTANPNPNPNANPNPNPNPNPSPSPNPSPHPSPNPNPN